MSIGLPLGGQSEYERPPHYPLLHPTCLHLGSFTHTFPTGMKPHRPARRANGRHARFHATHMAAHLRRIVSTFIWIITLVSSSRTRTYPPNEGEYGGNRRSRVTHSGCSLLHVGKHRCVRSVRVLLKSKANMHEIWTGKKVGIWLNLTSSCFFSPIFSHEVGQ